MEVESASDGFADKDTISSQVEAKLIPSEISGLASEVEVNLDDEGKSEKKEQNGDNTIDGDKFNENDGEAIHTNEIVLQSGAVTDGKKSLGTNVSDNDGEVSKSCEEPSKDIADIENDRETVMVKDEDRLVSERNEEAKDGDGSTHTKDAGENQKDGGVAENEEVNTKKLDGDELESEQTKAGPDNEDPLQSNKADKISDENEEEFKEDKELQTALNEVKVEHKVDQDGEDETSSSAEANHDQHKSEHLNSAEDNLEANGSDDPNKMEKAVESKNEIETESLSKEEVVSDKPKKDEWLDILGNGMLKKMVLVSGKGQETRPKPGNEVTVIVNGKISNGDELKENTVVFIMDDRDVVQALELGVALMEVGERSVLYTDSKYAYGPFGRDDTIPKVPKNCSITYELELVSVADGPDRDNMSDDERATTADKKRLRGNSLYTHGDFGGAIECYKRGLKYLDGSAGKEVIEMKVKCQNNLSAAQLKVNAFQAALQSCNSVLNLQSSNIKAMFRKAKCLEALGDAKEALKCLKEASMLDPSNKLIHGELMRLGKYIRESHQKESDMYKRMVEGLKKEEAEKEETDDSFSFKMMVGTLVVVGIGVLAGFIWNRH